MGIWCCKGCIPPKRYPGCHGSCPEYIEEKAEHEKRKEIYDRERDISVAIYYNRGEKVNKAMKNRKK